MVYTRLKRPLSLYMVGISALLSVSLAIIALGCSGIRDNKGRSIIEQGILPCSPGRLPNIDPVAPVVMSYLNPIEISGQNLIDSDVYLAGTLLQLEEATNALLRATLPPAALINEACSATYPCQLLVEVKSRVASCEVVEMVTIDREYDPVTLNYDENNGFYYGGALALKHTPQGTQLVAHELDVGAQFVRQYSFSLTADLSAQPPLLPAEVFSLPPNTCTLAGLFNNNLNNLGDIDGDGSDDQFMSHASGSKSCIITAGQTLTIPNPIAGALGTFGWQMVLLGDVNGNSSVDLAISDYSVDPDPSDPGAPTRVGMVYIFDSADLLAGQMTPFHVISGLAQVSSAQLAHEMWFGYSLERIGNRLFVGSSNFGTNGQDGRVFIFDIANNFSSLGTLNHQQSNERFGKRMTAIGDLSGDGVSELAISGSRVYVYDGQSCLGPNNCGAPVLTVHRPQEATQKYADRIVNAGDMNGDTLNEIAIADTGVNQHAGRVYIISGTSVSSANTEVLTELDGDNVGDHFGVSLQAAEDVNNDGFAELCAGAIQPNSVIGTNAGYVRCFSIDAGL